MAKKEIVPDLPPDGYVDDAPPDGFIEESQAAPAQPASKLDVLKSAVARLNPVNVARAATNPAAQDAMRKALPAVGGVAGVLAGGGAASVPLAALGAAGGEAFGQLWDRARGRPSPETSLDAAKSIGKEGAIAGTLQGVTAGAAVAVAPTVKFVGQEVLAPIASALSNVPKKEIIRLAKEPMDILLSATAKKLGPKFDEIYKAFGLREADIRLIAKAEAKSGLGAQSVWDDVMTKITNKEPVSIGELIAARRAASKLGYSTKEGMLGTQFKKDKQVLEDMLMEKAPEVTAKYMGLLKEYGKTMTRSQFLSLLPRNRNGSTNALRSMFAGGSIAINPMMTAAFSPVTTGVGTVVASGVGKLASAAAKSPTARQIPPALAQLFRRAQQPATQPNQ